MEILLVIVLIGILSVIIVIPVMTAATAWKQMSGQNEVAQQARIALERFVRELRSIQRVNGRPSIVSPLAATQIQFIMATGQNVTYSWDGVAGSPLVRTDVNGADNAALNIQDFNLLYYEDSNALIANVRQEAESAPVTCDGGAGCTPTGVGTASGGNLVLLDGVTHNSIEYRFTGTRFAWIGPKDNNLGIANGRIETDPGLVLITQGPVDQYASVASPQQVLFMSPLLNYGDYIATIDYSGNQNPSSAGDTVAADSFDLVLSRVVVELEVGDGDFTTTLRNQVSFRRIE